MAGCCGAGRGVKATTDGSRCSELTSARLLAAAGTGAAGDGEIGAGAAGEGAAAPPSSIRSGVAGAAAALLVAAAELAVEVVAFFDPGLGTAQAGTIG